MLRYQKEFFQSRVKSDFVKYLAANNVNCYGGYDHIPLDRYPYFKDQLFLKHDPLWSGLLKNKAIDFPEQPECENAKILAREFVWISQFVLLREDSEIEKVIAVIKGF